MIIKKIQIKNFLSHVDSVLELKSESKVLLDGVSGSGKSSVVEAIIWGLYGKGRVENRNIVRRGAKETIVVLELVDGKKEYRIERRANLTGKHSLLVGEKKAKAYIPMKHIGLKDSQRWIEKELLKSSYALFINSVAYPQDNIENFVKQTASKRKELLLEIADTEDYDHLYNKSKDLLNSIEVEKNDKSVRIEFIENNIKEIELEKKNLQSLKTDLARIDLEKKSLSSIISLNKDFLEKTSSIKKEIEILSNKRDSIKLMIESNNDDISNANLKMLSLPNDNDILSVQKKIDDLKKFVEDLPRLKELQAIDYKNETEKRIFMSSAPTTVDRSQEIKKLEDDLMSLYTSDENFCEYIGKICPKLETAMQKRSSDIQERIAAYKSEMEESARASNEYSEKFSTFKGPVLNSEDISRINSMEDALKSKTELEIKMASINEQARNINSIREEIKMKSLKGEELAIEMAETEKLLSAAMMNLDVLNASMPKINSIDELESEMEIINSKFFSIKANINTIEGHLKNLEEIKKDRDALKNDLKKIKYNEECLLLAKDAFGSKGIKTVVIDYIIPRLEYRINDILSKMSDFKIRLETQKGKFDGEGVSEGLFINIYNDSGECFSFQNYSGGQKMKITIAIAEALASMQRCSFRIFDEIFTALDEDSLDGFSEVIHSLQDKFSQIICISHIRSIKDSFEQKINIINENGRSKILS